MPAGRPSDDDPGSARLGLGQRILLRLPRLGGQRSRESLGDRFREAVLKPEPAGAARTPSRRVREEEAEARARRMDDQERLIGLSMAPLAGLIAILVHAHQVANNPPVGKPHHVSAGLALELEIVLLVLAVVMLGGAWFARRFVVGIAAALYGLAVFNLHWWGFGIPFVLMGAFFLVRQYRAQQEAKNAKPSGRSPRPGNKRYTPPT